MYIWYDYVGWKSTQLILFIMKSSTKKKNTVKKPKKGWYRTEEFELNDGDILVYRSNKSGLFWSINVWLKGEKRYYVKSLGTKSKEDAIVRAKEIFLELQWKIKNNIPIFDKSLGELIKLYLDDQEERVHYGRIGKGKDGTITEGRWKNKVSTFKWLVRFMEEIAQGDNTKLSTLKKDMFKTKYLKFRRKKKQNVSIDTIISERSEINALYKFGIEKEWLQQMQFPKWEDMEKSGNVRQSFTREQWREIYTYIRHWDKKLGDRVKPTGGVSEQEEIDKRQFVRYMILILCNTGMRIGECKNLRWKDITIKREKDGTWYSELNIRIGKNGSRKGIIGRKGEYFNKIKEFSNYTSNEDYVFVENTTGEQISKKTIYRLWDEIIDNTSMKDSPTKYTYYCLRHTFASFRIAEDASPYRLAKNMGTSLKELEKTYDHSLNTTEDARKEILGGKLTESDRVIMERY